MNDALDIIPGGTRRFTDHRLRRLPWQLLLGLGHAAFAVQDWKEAQRRFSQLIEQFPSSDAAAESQYWKGVAKYKATNDASALTDIYKAFQTRYSDSSWAKKASVWGPAA